MINRLVILAAVLIAVSMAYSMANLLGVADAMEPESSQASDTVREQSPYAAKIVRPDGTSVMIQADHARVWEMREASNQRPAWLELEGDVTIDTPEGRIHAARLAYDPQTGRYHADSLGLIPAAANN